MGFVLIEIKFDRVRYKEGLKYSLVQHTTISLPEIKSDRLTSYPKTCLSNLLGYILFSTSSSPHAQIFKYKS